MYNCPDCEGFIPQESAHCPNCETQISHHSNSSKKWLAGLGIALTLNACAPPVAALYGAPIPNCNDDPNIECPEEPPENRP